MQLLWVLVAVWFFAIGEAHRRALGWSIATQTDVVITWRVQWLGVDGWQWEIRKGHGYIVGTPFLTVMVERIDE